MKKSNPLKTFNDNYDKKVDSFNKNLKKFQGDVGTSQVLKAFGPKRVDYVYPNSRDELEKAKKFASDALRKEMIKSMTNRKKPLAEDSIKSNIKRPMFQVDPSTGNMSYQKKGGQTKSKKK